MSFDIISDRSKENLLIVPEQILEKNNLKMLFLEGNLIERLPLEFFQKLPMLSWLDLRNNRLRELPRGIGHHKHLECLFLTNNQIHRLPNELGTVSTLRALQVGSNPLVYPPKNIISEGTNAMRSYLKAQYEIGVNESDKDLEEALLKVVDMQSTNPLTSPDESYTVISRTISKNKNKYTNSSFVDTYKPSVFIKQLSKVTIPSKPPEEQLKIIHKLNRTGSKISLKSYFNKWGIKHSLSMFKNDELKDAWMDKLRILLSDQERILQQEKNMRALTSWRHEKKQSMRAARSESILAKTPYATSKEYAKIPTREQLQQQFATNVDEKQNYPSVVHSEHSGKKVQVDMLISDLVGQLKSLESAYTEMKSPKSEIQEAGNQIKMIMDIHKKLLRLQASNDSILE